MTRTTQDDRSDLRAELRRRRLEQVDNPDFLDTMEAAVVDAERCHHLEAEIARLHQGIAVARAEIRAGDYGHAYDVLGDAVGEDP